jgi:hypothetical protein
VWVPTYIEIITEKSWREDKAPTILQIQDPCCCTSGTM